MQKVVIGLSGGMDSATLLGLLLERGYEVHCCNFVYGSKHNPYEREAARKIVEYYKANGMAVVYNEIDLTEAFSLFSSNLLKSGEAIPEGHYNDENMRKTVVPGRNMILGAIMAGYAESIGATKVALGVHSGDHHIYPDCRGEFIKAFDTAVYLSSDGKVDVIAPLLKADKHSILEEGYNFCELPVPYHLTRTCYKDQEISCGKCGSCQERLEAFEKFGITDPIPYQS